MNKGIRILYYAKETESYMSNWQRYHYIDELSRIGVHFELFNPNIYNDPIEAHSKLIDQLKKNPGKYDLFFTGFGDNHLTSQFLNEIKQLGLFTLLICYDNLHAPFKHKNIASSFDLVWLTSYETKDIFENSGAKTIFQPYAANPYFYKPCNKTEIDSVGFIGNIYGGRTRKINWLATNDVPVSLYSSQNINQSGVVTYKPRNFREKAVHSSRLLRFSIGRKLLKSELIALLKSNSTDSKIVEASNVVMNPQVSFEKMIELISSFAISLNIIEIRNSYLLKNPLLKLHLRTFEIPMAGGLQLVNYTDEIASYFDNKKEILLYRTKEELISLAKFYLQDTQRHNREKMKKAARNRALSDHTWTKRFTNIFNHIGI